MKEDPSVVRLRARLVGKTVTSVEQSTLSESYYFIRTSDGESFHICGTELGSWIVDGPRHDGTYPSIGALAQAVGDHRYGKRMYDEPLEVVTVDDVLVVDAGDGELFRVRPSAVEDDWERAVLSHPRAKWFMRVVALDGLMWRSWFNKDCVLELEDENRIPQELMLPPSGLTQKS
jgi:hypothetical protein